MHTCTVILVHIHDRIEPWYSGEGLPSWSLEELKLYFWCYQLNFGKLLGWKAAWHEYFGLKIHDSKLWYLTVTATSVVAVSVLLKWHFRLLWWFLMMGSHVYCFLSSIMEPPLIDPTGTRLRMMAVKRENGACRQQLHWTYLWWKWRKWWKWWNMDQLFFFLCWFCCSCSSCCCCLGRETLLVWSLLQNMDQNFVDCGKLHAASKLHPLGYDHVFLFGLKLNRTNRRCRIETPMYISCTRVPCQCQVFSFQTCFLFILFNSQFFEPPKGTQMC